MNSLQSKEEIYFPLKKEKKKNTLSFVLQFNYSVKYGVLKHDLRQFHLFFKQLALTRSSNHSNMWNDLNKWHNYTFKPLNSVFYASINQQKTDNWTL